MLISVIVLGYASVLASGHRLVFGSSSKVKKKRKTRNLTWSLRPSIRPFVYDLVSAAKPFVCFGDILFKYFTKSINCQSTQLYFISTTLHAADRSVHYQVHTDLKYLF